jgi:hypothetical protein
VDAEAGTWGRALREEVARVVGGGAGGEGREVGEPTVGAVTGRARGGSYAVPRSTLWTPNQDSVAAAAVVSAQTQVWSSPRCTTAMVPHHAAA